METRYKTLKEVEIYMILDALRRHDGNRTRAAKELGISIRAMRNKIKYLKKRCFEIPDPKTGVKK